MRAYVSGTAFFSTRRYFAAYNKHVSCEAALRVLNSLFNRSVVLGDIAAPHFPGARPNFRQPSAHCMESILEREESLTLGRVKCVLYPKEDGVFALRDMASAWWFRELFVTAARLCDAQVNQYDLHHAHWFEAPTHSGLLFHAREYPMYCEAFPYNLGYCQRGSELQVDDGKMIRRNVLYCFGDRRMYLLDGAALAPWELQGVYTVDESLFGSRVADLFACSYHLCTGRYVCGGARDVRIVPFSKSFWSRMSVVK